MEGPFRQSLGVPAESVNFKQNHFDTVNTKLDELVSLNDTDIFSRESFTCEEVIKGVDNLNSGKAPGYDSFTKEHIQNAGFGMVRIITLIFNQILVMEYIPINFRRGV